MSFCVINGSYTKLVCIIPNPTGRPENPSSISAEVSQFVLQVAVRCRPLNAKEKLKGRDILRVVDDKVRFLGSSFLLLSEVTNQQLLQQMSLASPKSFMSVDKDSLLECRK
jgi:hypothetical protein